MRSDSFWLIKYAYRICMSRTWVTNRIKKSAWLTTSSGCRQFEKRESIYFYMGYQKCYKFSFLVPLTQTWRLKRHLSPAGYTFFSVIREFQLSVLRKTSFIIYHHHYRIRSSFQTFNFIQSLVVIQIRMMLKYRIISWKLFVICWTTCEISKIFFTVCFDVIKVILSIQHLIYRWYRQCSIIM